MFKFLTKSYFENNNRFIKCQDIKSQSDIASQDGRLLVISHLWETPADPDPLLMQFNHVKYLMKDFDLCFYDFCSIPQLPRTPEEELEFQTLLLKINRLYSSSANTVVTLTDDQRSLERGWIYYETAISLKAEINKTSIIPPAFQIYASMMRSKGDIPHPYSESYPQFEILLKEVQSVLNHPIDVFEAKMANFNISEADKDAHNLVSKFRGKPLKFPDNNQAINNDCFLFKLWRGQLSEQFNNCEFFLSNHGVNPLNLVRLLRYMDQFIEYAKTNWYAHDMNSCMSKLDELLNLTFPGFITRQHVLDGHIQLEYYYSEIINNYVFFDLFEICNEKREDLIQLFDVFNYHGPNLECAINSYEHINGIINHSGLWATSVRQMAEGALKEMSTQILKHRMSVDIQFCKFTNGSDKHIILNQLLKEI